MDLQELENEISIIEEKKKEIVKNFENIFSFSNTVNLVLLQSI